MIMKLLSSIPEVNIKSFNGSDSPLLVLKLEELAESHKDILTRPHRTGDYQLVLISEGSGTASVDTVTAGFHASSFFAFSKGQVVTFNFERNSRGFLVFFSEEYIYQYPEGLKWINDLKLFDPFSNSFLLNLQEIDYADIGNIIDKLDTELKSVNKFAQDEFLKNSLKILLIKSERLKRKSTGLNFTDSGDAYYIVEFRKKLEERYNKSRLVREYANSLNITSKKLNHIINSHCGKPVKRLIEERVILEIKRLLLYTDETIKEIGHQLGFSDPTNFNKFFKRHVKMTPLDFRISNRQSALYY